MKRETGFGLLEVILAIGILMAIVPFVYLQVSRRTQSIHEVQVAQQLDALKKACDNYLSLNADSWKVGFSEIVSDQDLLVKMKDYGLADSFRHFSSFIKGYDLQSSKYEIEGEGESLSVKIDSYLIIFLTDTFSPVEATRLLEHLGNDAGYADEGIVYGNKDGWQEKLDGANHAIVYRLNAFRSAPKENPFLSRSSAEANTMATDLYFGKGYKADYSVENVRDVTVDNLIVSNRLQSNFLFEQEETQSILFVKEAFFYNTLYLREPSEISNFYALDVSSNVRVIGSFSADTLDPGTGSLTISLGEDSIDGGLVVSDSFKSYDLSVLDIVDFSPKAFSVDFLQVSELKISNSLNLTYQLQVQDGLSFVDDQGVFGNVGSLNLYNLSTRSACGVTEYLNNIYLRLNLAEEGFVTCTDGGLESEAQEYDTGAGAS